MELTLTSSFQDQTLELDFKIKLSSQLSSQKTKLFAQQLRGELLCLLEYAPFSHLTSLTTALSQYLISDRRYGVDAVLLFVAGKTLHTQAHDKLWKEEQTSYGFVDIIFEEPARFGIYRLRIAPHACIPTHLHHYTREYEIALSSGLLLQNSPLIPGICRAWPLDFPHRYDNPSDQEQQILCIDVPSFQVEDEVYVEVENSELKDLNSDRKKLFWTPSPLQ